MNSFSDSCWVFFIYSNLLFVLQSKREWILAFTNESVQNKMMKRREGNGKTLTYLLYKGIHFFK